MGALLVQIHGNQQKVISAASKTFTECEQRWSTSEREAYCIVTMCEHYDYYLRGPRAFTVLTDHRPLTSLDVKSFGSPKIARWQLRLQRYRFIVQYIKGSQNVWADLLSRPFDVIPKRLIKDGEVMGSYYKFDDDSTMEIYIPSWTQKNNLPKELILKKSQVTSCYTLGHCFVSGFEKLPISEFRIIEEAQASDETIGTIRDLVRNKVEREKWKAPDDAYEWTRLKRFAEFYFIDTSTNLLLIKLEGSVPSCTTSRTSKQIYSRRPRKGPLWNRKNKRDTTLVLVEQQTRRCL